MLRVAPENSSRVLVDRTGAEAEASSLAETEDVGLGFGHGVPSSPAFWDAPASQRRTGSVIVGE